MLCQLYLNKKKGNRLGKNICSTHIPDKKFIFRLKHSYKTIKKVRKKKLELRHFTIFNDKYNKHGKSAQHH